MELSHDRFFDEIRKLAEESPMAEAAPEYDPAEFNDPPSEPPPDLEDVAAPAPPKVVGQISTRKRAHVELILEGIASKCAHCGMALTDAVSIEAGMGPVCRGHGYNLEPDQPDEIMAMAALCEYPELVDFLVQNYKPKGIRGLMNGLVKVCSLNRKTEVHDVCTNAIELLGYRKLASALRESLSVVEISDHPNFPDAYVVWIKRDAWKYAWSSDLRLKGVSMRRVAKGSIVEKRFKRVLWESLLAYYEGLCCTVRTNGEKKTVRIVRKAA